MAPTLTPATTGDLAMIDAMGPGRDYYRTRQRLTVNDVAGAPLAQLSLVPPLYVGRALEALRRTRPLPQDERIAAMARAADVFEQATVAGLDPVRYREIVSRVSGVPVTVVDNAVNSIAEVLRGIAENGFEARPQGAVGHWRDPRTRAAESGRAVWTRRGEVLAVHAAGNHPGPHGLWPEALALGYRVAVRPSQREPFTGHRLITALRSSGFDSDQVIFLPTDHAGAGQILERADLGMVYGGDEVVRKYAWDTRVLPQGPGRAKILITAEQDWREHLDTIVTSVAGEAGVACINATALLVEGDPRPLAGAIAERLAHLPSLPPQHPSAALPVQPLAQARALEQYLQRAARDAEPVLGGEGIVHELGDGSAVLRPAVHLVGNSRDPRLGIELPFPCVWVAPWSRADPLVPLQHSLVLTAITTDEDLIGDLVDDPTIANVHVGDHPTHWMRPGVPHDSYLGEFLMRTKTVIRE
ncbi:aldehyde dehydrogenase family protein [Kineosporia sp. NBRC 101731]|uniref:aldehyde dehydrogenase family protein n=1 Tax=Kineosporia sp. NBRC 101731 TaxID=3032199 RepID=UPI0024A29434|nr:aldehyde dehydrogenase family protein [Kineosporia sp. NBRC 101731]GLY32347.1 aldehyde dehydrogenase [Kineosporia sp. NBRC 101731]